MKHLINYCEESNIKKINLEVNFYNEIAISLYNKLGFKEVGYRKNYYKSSDAILLSKTL